MIKIFNILICTLLCLFCIMPDAMADTNYTANTTINIRAKADKSGKVLGKVQAGDTISVSSIEGDWAAIDFKGKTAYVSKEYITEVVVEQPAVEEEKEEDSSWGMVLWIVLIVGIVFVIAAKKKAQAEQAKKDAEEAAKKKAQEEQARKKAEIEASIERGRAILAKRIEEAKKIDEAKRNATSAPKASSDSAEQRAYAAKFEAVDLGLSVKWANMNIGAEDLSQGGDLFAWGEVEPKEDYELKTYKHSDGTGKESGITKYRPGIDGKDRLDKADDVAHKKMGGKWRMPSKEEFEELKTKCQWLRLDYAGGHGYMVKGPNGKSIFLPAAGLRVGTSLVGEDLLGRYWSSSLSADLPAYAWNLDFNTSIVGVYGDYRRSGRCVRPVSD